MDFSLSVSYICGMGQAQVKGVTTAQPNDDIDYTGILQSYILIATAPISLIRTIIPQKTGIGSPACLSLLICLYLKPSARGVLVKLFNSGTYSVNRRVDYLCELGYLKQTKYYWRSKAVAGGYISAVRYSVNAKGEVALRRLIYTLKHHSKK